MKYHKFAGCLLLGFALCVCLSPSFAAQKMDLDFGILLPLPELGLVPLRRIVFEKDNLLILQRQIGTVFFNDNWQFAIAFNKNLNLKGLEIWPGFALSQAQPKKSVAISPVLYLRRPSFLFLLGTWNFVGELYPFVDNLFLWLNLHNKFKLWGINLKFSLGMSSNLKYQTLETANLLDISIGAFHEF